MNLNPPRTEPKTGSRPARSGGLASWLLQQFQQRFKATPRSQPRLALLERITLAPRQTLALVEAEGTRFLVATAAEGVPVLYVLDGTARGGSRPLELHAPARIS